MPHFDLEIPHTLELPDVRTRLDKARGKLETDYGATCTWQGQDKLLVARPGLKATVSIQPTMLHVDVELGLLLSALLGGIRSGITKQLTELLTSSPA